MPLAKHKSGGKLVHILCDVFLLVFSQTFVSEVACLPRTSHDLDALTDSSQGNILPYSIIESILRDQNVPNYISEVDNNLRSLRRKRSLLDTSTNLPATTTTTPELSRVDQLNEQEKLHSTHIQDRQSEIRYVLYISLSLTLQ